MSKHDIKRQFIKPFSNCSDFDFSEDVLVRGYYAMLKVL